MSVVKSILLVDTSYPVNTRNARFLTSLKNAFPQANIACVAWNRDHRALSNHDDIMYVYEEPVAYGNIFKKLLKMYGFYSYLRHLNQRIHPNIIIASHWDTLLLCSRLKRNDQVLIYENLDIPSGGKVILSVLHFLEKRALRRVDCITFASRFYLPLYENYSGKKIVVENKLPDYNCCPVFHKFSAEDCLVLAFIGAIRYAPILENLISAVGGLEKVMCLFYGDGPDYDKIRSFGESYPNIQFFGRYDYTSVPQLYESVDVVWAVYPSNDYNVRYAISNKYHESLYYGVPAIFSADTELGHLVLETGTGFVVDCYSVDSIRNLILTIRDNKEQMLSKVCNALEKRRKLECLTWNEEVVAFIDYVNRLQ